jgi:putative RNA 2'-phosphotransferase
MNKRLTRISKYLTFILRHEPQSIGLQTDADGWLNIEELVSSAQASGKSITIEQVREVLALSEETRFEVSEDDLRIRDCEPLANKIAPTTKVPKPNVWSKSKKR